jgi:hypothetical protein
MKVLFIQLQYIMDFYLLFIPTCFGHGGCLQSIAGFIIVCCECIYNHLAD